MFNAINKNNLTNDEIDQTIDLVVPKTKGAVCSRAPLKYLKNKIIGKHLSVLIENGMTYYYHA